jgi:hypothetical protein
MMDYPDTLPIPNAMPYNWDVGLGITTIKMNAGNLIPRRRFNHLPHQFAFLFAMDTNDMVQFAAFVDEVGSDWFNIRGLSMWSGNDPEFIKKIPVRFTSNINVAEAGYNWWSISVAAELSPNVYWNTLVGDWIDAGYPALPSLNWIEAGSPQNPSPSFIDGGTTTRPSSPL